MRGGIRFGIAAKKPALTMALHRRGREHERASASHLLPVLIFSTLVMSVIATLGTPMVPTIAREQNVSLEAAQWLLTITLLVGAVATPISGRLADGPWRKRVILFTLLTVCAGATLSATITIFPVFILGRALQGFGLGLLPLAISVARDALPRDQVRSGVAKLSITTAVGTGLGYPITGLIAETLSYRAAFGFAAIISVIAFVLVWRVVPSASPHKARPLDIAGALLLSMVLVSLLLAISQGRTWGWTSPPILLLALVSIVAGSLWVRYELRIQHPLVELRLATNRMVMSANITSFLMGVGLFSTSSLINRYVQAPEASGYGFGLGLIATGFILMPLSLGSLFSSWFSRWLIGRFSQFFLMPMGALIMVLIGVFLAIDRSSLWQIAIAVTMLGLGLSTTFAAMPPLIISAVPANETGSANGFNNVVRSVGGAIGSAASIALLSNYTPAGEMLPTDHGYTIAFLGAAVACLGAVVAAVVLTPREAMT